MNKYINITKDNCTDYLFKDIECEFSNSASFWHYHNGYLAGVFMYPKGFLSFKTYEDGVKGSYSYCRTKNPDYKEEKPVFDPEGYFGDIKGPSKSIQDYKGCKKINYREPIDYRLMVNEGSLLWEVKDKIPHKVEYAETGMPYFKVTKEEHKYLFEEANKLYENEYASAPKKKIPDLREKLKTIFDICGNDWIILDVEKLHNLLKQIIKRLPE